MSLTKLSLAGKTAKLFYSVNQDYESWSIPGILQCKSRYLVDEKPKVLAAL
jgi:hypothetical protein